MNTPTTSTTTQPPAGSRYGRDLAAYTGEYLTLAARDQIIADAQAAAAARRRPTGHRGPFPLRRLFTGAPIFGGGDA